MVQPLPEQTEFGFRPDESDFLETAAFYYQFKDERSRGPYHPDPCTGAYRYMCAFWRDRTPTLGLSLNLSEVAMLAEFHALSGL